MSPTAECDASPPWDLLCDSLAIPVERVHLNERSQAVAQATEGRTPRVLAEVDGQLLSILSADAIGKRKGDVSTFDSFSIDVGRERTRR